MRKLVESTFMTLDGVIESPQDWSPPYWDDEHVAYARKLLFAADALLLGRATYEAFAQAWPARSGDEYTDRINAMPKFVTSRTLQEATWNATVIQGDVAEEVEKLKREPGQDILKFGTGDLDRTLLANSLIDELHVWVFPVLVGKGQRLIDGIETTHLNLVETTRFASGIVVLTYAPKEGE
jgi:dihydrofolate reductase